MRIKVKAMRDLIAGLPDDAEIGLIEVMDDTASELAYAELEGVEMGEDGVPRVVVRVGEYDEDDEDLDTEPGDIDS